MDCCIKRPSCSRNAEAARIAADGALEAVPDFRRQIEEQKRQMIGQDSAIVRQKRS